MRPLGTLAVGLSAVLLVLSGTTYGWSTQYFQNEGVHGRSLQAKKDGKVVHITEENAKDFPSIVEGAKDGMTIVISIPNLQLRKSVEITSSITLRGSDPVARPRIKCKEREAWFTVSASDVFLEDFFLSECKGPAVRVVNEPYTARFGDPETLKSVEYHNVHITNVEFFDNRDEERGFNADGGALSLSGGTNVNVTSCSFRNNFAELGGGIYVQSPAVLHVEDSKFEDNEALISGGAISTSNRNPGGDEFQTSFTIVNCAFVGNKDLEGVADANGVGLRELGSNLEASEFLQFGAPQASGGAIYVIGFNTVSIKECTFDSNSAVPAGGALFVADNTDVQLVNNLFQNNSVYSSSKVSRQANVELGGGVYVSYADSASRISILGCVFKNNTASYGGAMHIVTTLGARVKFEDCLFEGNMAYVGGGGLAIRNTIQASMRNVKMRHNRATAGGAILVTNGAGIIFVQGQLPDKSRDCTFEDNLAYDGGAWFFLGAGQVVAQAIIMQRNHAIRNGGGAYLVESLASGDIWMQDYTMMNNTAARGGAIYMNSIVQLKFLTLVGRKSVFMGNIAGIGGAMYLEPSSHVNNDIRVAGALFEKNQAIMHYKAWQPRLDIPLFGNEGDGTGEDTTGLSSLHSSLNISGLSGGQAQLELDGPCAPGGGGAICFALNRIPERARVEAQVLRNSFINNYAESGGALYVETTKGSNWVQECPTSNLALSTSPCRAIRVQACAFLNNTARGAGGAVFMTDANAVYYGTEEVSGMRSAGTVRFSTVVAPESERISGNLVLWGGYGKVLASSATHLKYVMPQDETMPQNIVQDHNSGHKLPIIKLAIVDAFDHIVSAGSVDSTLKVQAESEHIAGQLVSVAKDGIVIFDTLTFTAHPGTYDLKFLADGLPPITTYVSVRGCMIGEFNVTEQKICTKCAPGFFGLDPMLPCQQCDEGAVCTGGPVLVPKDGYWHSTPFSPQIHDCLSDGACSYEGREDKLKLFYSDYHNLVPTNDLLENSVYPQCNEGYENVLCGACSPGYGHFEGGECVKCKSKKMTFLFIFLIALWSLALLVFTIRSSLSSIRDFNDMRAIMARKAQAQMMKNGLYVPPTQTPRNTGVVADPQNVFYNAPDQNGDNVVWKPEPTTPKKVGDPLSFIEEQGMNSYNASIDHIIAAENLSETLKIAVNFLQVTSVAISINANWSHAIEKTLAIQDLLSGFSNGASLIAVDCVLSHESSVPISIRALVLRLAFPIVLLIMVVGFFFLYWIHLYRKKNESIMYFRSRTIICSLVVLFFAYEFITQELMRIINCVNIDMNPPELPGNYSTYSIARGKYWGEDTSLRCYEGSHARLVGSLGAPGMIIFSLGIPMFVLIFLLWNKGNNKLNDQAFLNTYGFIFQNYKDNYVYWEVMIMFRKALVDGIVVFTYPLGPNLQGVLALGVLIVSLILHLVALPYKYKVLNMLEGASLVVSIFMFYSGIVFNDSNTSHVARLLLSALLIAINIGLLVLYIVHGIQQVNKFFAAKLHLLHVDVPKGFIPRVYKFCKIMVSRAAVEVQEHGKNHPLVKGMSMSIRSIRTQSTKLGRNVSRRMSRIGSTASIASQRSSRSIDSLGSVKQADSVRPSDLSGIPEMNSGAI